MGGRTRQRDKGGQEWEEGQDRETKRTEERGF
jgi:hypothetical protein